MELSSIFIICSQGNMQNFVYNRITLFSLSYCLAMLDHLEQFLPNKEPSSIQNFPFLGFPSEWKVFTTD